MIEWSTNLENMQHAVKNGYRINAVQHGEKCNFSKLKTEDVLFIRANYNKKTMNYKALSDKFEISISQISHIINRITWTQI